MSSHGDFCNQVRDRRQARGWTQVELRGGPVFPARAVSAIEVRRLAPSVTAALRLAECLGCTVEELFGISGQLPKLEWAWPPGNANSRYWRAEVAGRLLSIPVEETASGEMAHDGVMESRADRYAPQFAPAQTLIMACCDPAAGLLASEYGRQMGLRMIVLPRSSGAALSLLAQGRIHVAGVHLAGAGDSHGNAGVVGRKIDKPVGLLRLAQWQEGVAIGSDNKSNSLQCSARTAQVGRTGGRLGTRTVFQGAARWPGGSSRSPEITAFAYRRECGTGRRRNLSSASSAKNRACVVPLPVRFRKLRPGIPEVVGSRPPRPKLGPFASSVPRSTGGCSLNYPATTPARPAAWNGRPSPPVRSTINKQVDP